MKHKRLDRDLWPDIAKRRYAQKRLDLPEFHGLAALLTIEAVRRRVLWTFPEGDVAVCEAGTRWLQLLPDREMYMITAVFSPNGDLMLWYIDIADGYGFAADGVAVYHDLYLDVVARPNGYARLLDQDELDEAFAEGELSPALHAAAQDAAQKVLHGLLGDLPALSAFCRRLLERMEAEA